MDDEEVAAMSLAPYWQWHIKGNLGKIAPRASTEIAPLFKHLTPLSDNYQNISSKIVLSGIQVMCHTGHTVDTLLHIG